MGFCTFRRDPEAGKQKVNLRFIELSAKTVAEIRHALRGYNLGTSKSPVFLSTTLSLWLLQERQCGVVVQCLNPDSTKFSRHMFLSKILKLSKP